MKGNPIYLDYNSTTKISDNILEKSYHKIKNIYGSSLYNNLLSQNVKNLLENSREKIASIFDAKPSEIIFTSGGTESNNNILKGLASASLEKGKHIISSKIEHKSILETLKYLEKQGIKVDLISSDKNGVIDTDEVRKKVRNDTILISITKVNDELGSIQEVEKISEIARERKVLFHSDMCTSIGKCKIDSTLYDTFSFSGHKFGALQGVGGFYLKEGIKLNKLIHGNEEENNFRAGSENLLGIYTMSLALKSMYENIELELDRERRIRDYIEKRLLRELDMVIINGNLEKRLHNTSNMSFLGVDRQEIISKLSEKNIIIGNYENINRLKALEDEKLIHSSIRISIGRHTTKEEADYFIDNIKKIVKDKRDQYN